MPKSRSIRNLLTVGGATGSRLLGTLILYSALARILGPARFAEFTFWYTVGIVLGALSDYGFGQQILVRLAADSSEIIKVEGTRLVKAKLMLVVGFFSATMICSIFFVDNSVNVLWIIPLLLACAAATLIEFFGVMLRARAQYQNEALRTFFATFFSSIGAALTGYLTSDLVSVCVVMFGVRVVVLYFQYIAAKVAVGFDFFIRDILDFAATFRTLKNGFYYAVDGGSVQLLSNADVLISKYFLTAESAGIYMAGSRLVQAALAGIPVLSNVFIPSLVSSRKKGNLGSPKLLKAVVAFISISSLLFFYFGGGAITDLLFGSEFSALKSILPIFGVIVSLRYMSSIDGFGLSVMQKQILRAGIHAFLSFVTLLLAVLLSIGSILSAFDLAVAVFLASSLQVLVYRMSIVVINKRPVKVA